MISNVLLDEKYRAQRRLSQRAAETRRDYLRVVEDEVSGLFKTSGWPLCYANRTGGFVARVAEERTVYGTRDAAGFV